MKTVSITVAALLAGAAEIAFAAPNAASCKTDVCAKALQASHVHGRVDDAKAFCAKYLDNATNKTSVPKYVAHSCKDASGALSALKISNACGCLVADPPRAVVPAPKSTGVSKAHPCAQISAVYARQKKSTTAPTVPAALAYDCFKSVPLNKAAAIQLVDGIMPYLEWQSDSAYKKDPPKDYAYPGFDMFANLAAVKSNLQAGKYATEYDFQLDLYKQVWAPGQDGHFVFYPDLLTRAFRWRRPMLPIVSVSEDGISLPVIKLQKDVVANAKTAPAITKINGIDAAKFIEDTVNSASFLQDPDAAYNTMFWSKSTLANKGVGNFVAGGRSSIFYPGPTTSLTFSNGTTLQLQNLATIVGDMTGVVDGPSMYKKFCSPMSAPEAIEAPGGTPNLTGYPEPNASTQDGAVTGYYLNGQGVDDVAVLALKNFEPLSPAEFQATIMDFLSDAKDAGKKKLVIDLQNNGGGLVLLGYDFFRQLFPKTVQEGNSRWRLSKSLNLTAQVISDYVKDVDPSSEADNDMVDLTEIFLNYRHDLNISDENFLTFADKFGPHVYKDNAFTNMMRWNLSDALTTSDPVHGLGIGITGYGSLTEQPQYFEPEDIILLYDGSCSSTCTVASEFLRLQGGVKSIAMGGRPKAGPMQGVGGVKGSQVLDFGSVYNFVSTAASLTNDTEVKAEASRFTNLPSLRSTQAFVNVRDHILHDNVNDGLPAQYVYEAADCRLYWTAPMISDVTEVWKAAANAAFNGGKCAYGSIPGSKPGRRSDPAAVARGHKPMRLSETVDKTPVKHNALWEAKHLQVAVN
ncbi:hypothetical protein E4U21_001747 [Claviceps maximensis]|nr:hypothetical protein E4U21_001747 [Claviceps maximensis]